jgi:hypothetical protein
MHPGPHPLRLWRLHQRAVCNMHCCCQQPSGSPHLLLRDGPRVQPHEHQVLRCAPRPFSAPDTSTPSRLTPSLPHAHSTRAAGTCTCSSRPTPARTCCTSCSQVTLRRAEGKGSSAGCTQARSGRGRGARAAQRRAWLAVLLALPPPGLLSAVSTAPAGGCPGLLEDSRPVAARAGPEPTTADSPLLAHAGPGELPPGRLGRPGAPTGAASDTNGTATNPVGAVCCRVFVLTPCATRTSRPCKVWTSSHRIAKQGALAATQQCSPGSQGWQPQELWKHYPTSRGMIWPRGLAV